jgi:hypothetical protein
MMHGNGIDSSGLSIGPANGVTAPSGYRVSMVAGALDVSARLSTPEELDLLVKVLEANKALWKTTTIATPGPQAKAKPTLELLDGVVPQKAGVATPQAATKGASA